MTHTYETLKIRVLFVKNSGSISIITHKSWQTIADHKTLDTIRVFSKHVRALCMYIYDSSIMYSAILTNCNFPSNTSFMYQQNVFFPVRHATFD